MRPNETGLGVFRYTAGSVAAATRAAPGSVRALSAKTITRAAGAAEARYLTTSASPREFCIAAGSPQRCESRN